MARRLNVTTTIITAAVGAAAGAAAVGLANKDNRKKLSKVVANVTRRAQEITDDLNKSSKPLLKTSKRIGSELAEDAKKNSKPIVRSAKDTVRDTLK